VIVKVVHPVVIVTITDVRKVLLVTSNLNSVVVLVNERKKVLESSFY
jgi:hypothetical protein